MCTNPLHLQRPNLGFSFDVPCNFCLECQSASQDSWLFGLSCDLDALYKRKGFGVFLTFTYSDACLPRSDFGNFFGNFLTLLALNSRFVFYTLRMFALVAF